MGNGTADAVSSEYATGGKTYDSEWFARCAAGSSVAAGAYCAHLWKFVQPKSVLDVGCGRGHWLDAWRLRGVEHLHGIDGEWIPAAQLIDASIQFEAVDLNHPFAIEPRVDLAMTLEVAEHLEPQSAETFVKSLTGAADLILFGAAYPHQGGPKHVNEKPHTYWAGLFAQHEYRPFDILRPTFWGDDTIPFWYRQNTFLYARQGSSAYDNLVSQSLQPMQNVWFMDCVHPQLYLCKIADIAGLKESS